MLPLCEVERGHFLRLTALANPRQTADPEGRLVCTAGYYTIFAVFIHFIRTNFCICMSMRVLSILGR